MFRKQRSKKKNILICELLIMDIYYAQTRTAKNRTGGKYA